MTHQITKPFAECREAIKALWNQYLLARLDPERIAQGVRVFHDIKAKLFYFLVIAPTGSVVTLQSHVEDYPCLFGVVPDVHAEILINREAGASSGYWDRTVFNVGERAVLRFIDFFDWDELNEISLKYCRVIISDSDKEGIIGHQALVPFEACIFTFEASEGKTADG